MSYVYWSTVKQTVRRRKRTGLLDLIQPHTYLCFFQTVFKKAAM